MDRKGDSSSRRHDGRDRDRDRDRDRNRDRNHHPRDAWSSRRNGRDGDGREERDRKRSRGSGRRDGDGDRARGDDRDRENPDDMWKRKLRDEDKQLKELDLDELMVDEEEEERRLEEVRRFPSFLFLGGGVCHQWSVGLLVEDRPVLVRRGVFLVKGCCCC